MSICPCHTHAFHCLFCGTASALYFLHHCLPSSNSTPTFSNTSLLLFCIHFSIFHFPVCIQTSAQTRHSLHPSPPLPTVLLTATGPSLTAFRTTTSNLKFDSNLCLAFWSLQQQQRPAPLLTLNLPYNPVHQLIQLQCCCCWILCFLPSCWSTTPLSHCFDDLKLSSNF